MKRTNSRTPDAGGSAERTPMVLDADHVVLEPSSCSRRIALKKFSALSPSAKVNALMPFLQEKSESSYAKWAITYWGEACPFYRGEGGAGTPRWPMDAQDWPRFGQSLTLPFQLFTRPWHSSEVSNEKAPPGGGACQRSDFRNSTLRPRDGGAGPAGSCPACRAWQWRVRARGS